jgi:regulator of replication initiation timing
MQANVDLVIQDLTNQIAKLSQEKAIFSALATQRTIEINQLKQENDELKRRLEELESENAELRKLDKEKRTS